MVLCPKGKSMAVVRYIEGKLSNTLPTLPPSRGFSALNSATSKLCNRRVNFQLPTHFVRINRYGELPHMRQAREGDEHQFPY